MEESINSFVTLLCIAVPCLVLVVAIVGGIVFFVRRSKKPVQSTGTPATPADRATAVARSADPAPGQFSPASTALAPSEVVALKGDLFAPSAGALNSWQVAGSVSKVSGPPLAQNMLAAAFLALEQAGDVRLSQDKKKAAFGLREVDTVSVTPVKQSANWPAGSFEARILNSAGTRQASGNNNVRNIVYDALQEEASLVWDWALRLAHNSMAKRGLLAVEVKKGLLSSGLANYSLTPATSAALTQTNPAEIQQWLESCKDLRPELFQLLNKEIKKGFDSRKEAADFDH